MAQGIRKGDFSSKGETSEFEFGKWNSGKDFKKEGAIT